MGLTVHRTRHALGRHRDRTTLAQTFRFEGTVTAAALVDVLRSSPLVGAGSVFGDRPGEEITLDTAEAGAPGPASRRLRRFSPAPGFRFDVELAEREDGVFIASFSQPDRGTPFLHGDALWLLSDDAGGAVLDEEINTERALAAGASPLGGPKPSLRRWLFFRVGHARVMRDATGRLAQLAQDRPQP